MKILKKGGGGVVEKRGGRRKRNPWPMRLWSRRMDKKVEEIILAMYFQNFLMKVFNTHLTLKSDPRESCFKNKNNMFAILRKNILLTIRTVYISRELLLQSKGG